jgi:transcriptional regulator with XRE-family HTH domain
MRNPDRIARQVGVTVRRLRQQRAETQYQVAGLAGILTTELSAYERGRQLPSVPVLARLLAALDCTEDHFSRHFGPFGLVDAIRSTGRL